MNKTDRFIAIMLELQHHRHRTADDLADTFQVSKRTIYRDMNALMEAGVPIISSPGSGYSIMDGYFLPPLNFSIDEALMLVLGSDFMEKNFDAQYQQAAKSARKKLEAILPPETREDLTYIEENISFHTRNELPQQKRIQLMQLRRAIVERRRLRLYYSKPFANEGEDHQTIRNVDPFKLAWVDNDWFLMGYCHLREDNRIFRLSRIDHLMLLKSQFQRPDPATLKWSDPSDNPHLIVEVLFTDEVKRWVLERLPMATVDHQEIDEGLLVTLAIRKEVELVPWLLGWGDQVMILSPDSMKAALMHTIETIQNLYQEEIFDY